MWIQREITLEPRPRGFHLVTREVLSALPDLREFEIGVLHLLIAHTSASRAPVNAHAFGRPFAAHWRNFPR